jgi:hypothetical protein
MILFQHITFLRNDIVSTDPILRVNTLQQTPTYYTFVDLAIRVDTSQNLQAYPYFTTLISVSN